MKLTQFLSCRKKVEEQQKQHILGVTSGRQPKKRATNEFDKRRIASAVGFIAFDKTYFNIKKKKIFQQKNFCFHSILFVPTKNGKNNNIYELLGTEVTWSTNVLNTRSTRYHIMHHMYI